MNEKLQAFFTAAAETKSLHPEPSEPWDGGTALLKPQFDKEFRDILDVLTSLPEKNGKRFILRPAEPCSPFPTYGLFVYYSDPRSQTYRPGTATPQDQPNPDIFVQMQREENGKTSVNITHYSMLDKDFLASRNQIDAELNGWPHDRRSPSRQAFDTLREMQENMYRNPRPLSLYGLNFDEARRELGRGIANVAPDRVEEIGRAIGTLSPKTSSSGPALKL